MKTLGLIFFLLLGATHLKAQSQPIQPITFFGQCMIEISTAEEMAQLQATMKENPYIKIVRLDYNTQRAFVLTQNLESLTEDNLVSWFNEYADKVRCVQVGLYGIDAMDPYPFKNCQK
jgi:hypothetical protein